MSEIKNTENTENTENELLENINEIIGNRPINTSRCSICKHERRDLIEHLYSKNNNVNKVKRILLEDYDIKVAWESLNRHFKECLLSNALIIQRRQNDYLERIGRNSITNQPLSNKLNFLEKILFDLVLLIGSKMNLKDSISVSKASRDIKGLSETIVKVMETEMKVLSLDKTPEEQIALAQKQMEKTLEGVLNKISPDSAEEVLKVLKKMGKEDELILNNIDEIYEEEIDYEEETIEEDIQLEDIAKEIKVENDITDDNSEVEYSKENDDIDLTL